MKKKAFFLSALGAAVILSASAAINNDPVVMTINGKDVRQSEFEYLYHKNNVQQLAPQTIDEYVDMFVVYKLKVAEAEAAGIDKTDEFKKEFDGYCAELSKPYMTDTLVENRLIKEAYGRLAHSRLVSHIMLPLGSTYDEREANRQRLDSIRDAIVNGGADFVEMAHKFSADRSVVRNNGSMGYMSINRFPYPFEKAAFDTPVGEISEVVEDAPYGFHIIRVEAERPNPGKVEARHILKLTQGLTPEEAASKKAQIDSIHSLLMAGGDFEAIARAESEDPGSAANGGNLGLFGPGEMVKEFEDTSFSLKDGEISKPFSTSYGYHIVQTISHKGIGSLEEETPAIKAAISRDLRSSMPETEKLEQLKATFGVNVDSTVLFSIKDQLLAAEDATSSFAAIIDNSTRIANVGAKEITVADVTASIPENVRNGSRDPFTTFHQSLEQLIDQTAIETARAELYNENPEYRNLVNEYRDGILLFEISNRNVWDRSTKDTQGLENYFRANVDKYSWEKPHYKGYVIFASSDSIASAAQGFLAQNVIENDSLVTKLRDNFGRNNIKVEKVVTGKGDNAIVDHVAFNGEKPAAPGKWLAWFGYQGKVLDKPEEATDVKSAVSTDYQQELEREWVSQLRSKYKVKLNKKALKKIMK